MTTDHEQLLKMRRTGIILSTFGRSKRDPQMAQTEDGCKRLARILLRLCRSLLLCDWKRALGACIKDLEHFLGE